MRNQLNTENLGTSSPMYVILFTVLTVFSIVFLYEFGYKYASKSIQKWHNSANLK